MLKRLRVPFDPRKNPGGGTTWRSALAVKVVGRSIFELARHAEPPAPAAGAGRVLDELVAPETDRVTLLPHFHRLVLAVSHQVPLRGVAVLRGARSTPAGLEDVPEEFFTARGIVTPGCQIVAGGVAAGHDPV